MTDTRNLITETIDGLEVKHSDIFEHEELAEYVKRGREKYGKHLHGLTVCRVVEDENMVDIFYDTEKLPFSRLRRITGYLVGDLSRWNNGKRAEERDRVKHDTN